MIRYVLLAALAAVILELGTVMILVPEKTLQEVFLREQEILSRELREAEQIRAAAFAAGAEQSVIRDSGLSRVIRGALVPDQDQRRRSGDLAGMGQGLFQQVSHRLGIMSMIFYEYMLRAGVFLAQWDLHLILWICFLSAGLIRRGIRRHSFAGSSSVRLHLGFRGLLASLWLFLMLDLSLVPFSALSALLQTAVLAWLAGVVVANLQKRL